MDTWAGAGDWDVLHRPETWAGEILRVESIDNG